MSTPTVVTDRATFRSVAADAPPGGRVPIELTTEVSDPFEAYRRARDGPGGVFLETTGGQSGWGYFAVEPVERLTVSADAVVASDATASAVGDYQRETPSLAALEGLLSGETLVRGDCSVPYPCGAFGWLSYDIARELESLSGNAVDDRRLPRLQVGVFDCVASWSEPRDDRLTLHLTCCPKIPEDATEAELNRLYDRAVDRASALATAAREGDPSVGEPPAEATEAEFESECGRAAFADRVRQIKQYIRDGDTFQTNLSQRLSAPAAVHPVAAYDALRRVNPAPYSGLLEFSGRGDDRWSGLDLVSASPELLLQREDDRLLTEPIAGTRPRGRTPEADDAFEAGSPKRRERTRRTRDVGRPRTQRSG